MTESDSHITFLAYQNNAIQGSTHGLTDRDRPHAGQVGGIWVDFRYRRQGSGRALLEAVFAWADEQYFTSLGLLTPAHSLAAFSLYRQVEFHETRKQRSLPFNPALKTVAMECNLTSVVESHEFRDAIGHS